MSIQIIMNNNNNNDDDCGNGNWLNDYNDGNDHNNRLAMIMMRSW